MQIGLILSKDHNYRDQAKAVGTVVFDSTTIDDINSAARIPLDVLIIDANIIKKEDRDVSNIRRYHVVRSEARIIIVYPKDLVPGEPSMAHVVSIGVYDIVSDDISLDQAIKMKNTYSDVARWHITTGTNSKILGDKKSRFGLGFLRKGNKKNSKENIAPSVSRSEETPHNSNANNQTYAKHSQLIREDIIQENIDNESVIQGSYQIGILQGEKIKEFISLETASDILKFEEVDAVFIKTEIAEIEYTVQNLRRMVNCPVVIIGECSAKVIEAGADECYQSLNAEVIKIVRAKAEKVKRLWQKANIDELTGCFQRNFMDSCFNLALQRFKEKGELFSVISFDLNDFKQINDTYGHNTGDKVLRVFGQHLKSNCRRFDIPIRNGGDEFILVLPDTGIKEATEISQRIQKSWNNKCTFSMGCAQVSRDGTTQEELLASADRLMYQHKRQSKKPSSIISNKPKQKVPKVIMVWSSLPQNGKTFVAANFAATLTWKGYSVILITSHPEVKWYNAKPVPLEQVLNNPVQAWKLGGQCEEITGVMLTSGRNIELIKDFKQLPCDVIVIDSNTNLAASDFILEVTNNGNVKPSERKNVLTVLNRVNDSDKDLISIPDRPAEAVRGIKRGIPPVIYSKELAEVFIKIEIAVGL